MAGPLQGLLPRPPYCPPRNLPHWPPREPPLADLNSPLIQFSWGWDDAGQSSSDLASQRLLAVVLGLVLQDRSNVIVGGHRQVNHIVLPPYGKTCASPDVRQVVGMAEAAEGVESCDGEAVLLPL